MPEGLRDPWRTSVPHLTTDGDGALSVTASDEADAETLPLVLAGPILRRVTDESVAVWIATHAEVEVDLEVRSGGSQEGTSGETSLLEVGSNLFVGVVEVSGLSLSPGTTYEYDLTFTFPGDRPSVVGGSGGASLSTPGVLAPDGNGLPRVHATGDESLPSFAIPPKDKNDLRFFHASCRKPHGKKRGALSAIRQPIADNLGTPTDRPHSLFLTGDQIYADDVADTFCTLLWNAGTQFLGRAEEVPLFEDWKEEWDTVTLYQLWPDYRQYYANNVAGMDTEPKLATSHLFGVGEYFAMYLAVWSDVLWPSGDVSSTFPDLETVWNDGQDIPSHIFRTIRNDNGGELPSELTDSDGTPKSSLTLSTLKDETQSPKVARDVVSEAESEYEDDKQRLQYFKEELSDVRRVLANVPTYMMWDDHDVTDDWFLTGEWVESVLSRPLGHACIQNGMLAANVCQMWGNQPTTYSGGSGETLLDGFDDYVDRDLDGPKSTELDDLLGIPHRTDAMVPEGESHADIYTPGKWNRVGASPMSGSGDSGEDDSGNGDSDGGTPDRITYHFALFPGEYGIGVLDTRTWRGYPSPKAAPELLSALGQRTQLVDFERTFDMAPWFDVPINSWDRSKPLFLVSPVPLWTVPLVDLGQEWGKHYPRETNNEFLQARDVPESERDWDIVSAEAHADYEHWRLQRAALESFLRDVSRLSEHVVTLSGDVHYGYTTRTEYWHNYDKEDKTAFSSRFANLTASAAKNESFLTNLLHPVGYTARRASAFGGWYHESAPETITEWNDSFDEAREVVDDLDPLPYMEFINEITPSGNWDIVDRYIYEMPDQQPTPPMAQRLHGVLERAANTDILKTDSRATLATPWNETTPSEQLITTKYFIEGAEIDFEGVSDWIAIQWDRFKEEGELELMRIPVLKLPAPTGTWSLSDNKPLLETIDLGTIKLRYAEGDIVLGADGPSDPYAVSLMRDYDLRKVGQTVVSWAGGNAISSSDVDRYLERLGNGWELFTLFGTPKQGTQSQARIVYQELDDIIGNRTDYGGVDEMLQSLEDATISHLEGLEEDATWGVGLLTEMQRGGKPHWEYRVDYLRGRQMTTESWEPSSGGSEGDATDPADAWRRFNKYRDYGGEVVGRNNVGEVTLDWGTQDLTFRNQSVPNEWRFVNHKLWWRMGGTAEAHPYTQFTVDMLPNALGIGGKQGVAPPSSTVPTGNVSSRPSDLIQGAVDVSEVERDNV
ncbi:hypothetical protein [Haloplanus salinarum]|uniref:DUF7800 domain-containing protein n=1 Tax=Haloplanus salinarum TaxID=1912324 RepID=UPI00214CB06C|nr:hypothetical protein [Haloplanus salinarum]